jgi:alpha-beta hydrolase superfamily lysophospholipase
MNVMRHGAPAQADTAILSLLQRRSMQAMPAVAKPMPPMPALLIQGEDDQVVRPVNQEHLTRQWLQSMERRGPGAGIQCKSRAGCEPHDD